MITIAQLEQEKYRRMWKLDGYRVTSPGQVLVPHFMKHADWQPGDTLIDLGCGPGRASVELSKAGFKVTQLDITETSRDPEVLLADLPFIEACLWELPVLPRYDWLYCTDVLEHLPTDKVDQALQGMAAITGKGAFLQIAMFAEGYGRHIGATLHLTIEQQDWWIPKINKYWHCSKFDIIDSRLIALTDGPK